MVSSAAREIAPSDKARKTRQRIWELMMNTNGTTAIMTPDVVSGVSVPQKSPTKKSDTVKIIPAIQS